MSPAEGPAIRAVLFDLEDTLVPWQTVAHWQWAWRPRGPVLSDRHVNAVLRRQLHSWDRRRWQGIVEGGSANDGSSYRKFVTETLTAIAGHSLPAEETSAVVDRFLKPPPELDRFGDVPAAVDAVRASGRAVGVFSELPGPTARAILPRIGLSADLLTGSAESPTGPPLPQPAAYRALATSLGVRPSQAFVVGDLFWSDVRAAGRGGLHGALLDRNGWSPRVESVRISNLTELPKLLDAPPEPTPEPPSDGEVSTN